MAVNPMQKKARNSFLLGMIITLVVCAIIGVILYIAVIGPENKASKEKGTATKAVEGRVNNMLDKLQHMFGV